MPLPLPFAEVGTLRRQLADAQSVDSGDLQRRLKDVTDMLYLKQTQVWAVCGGGWAGGCCALLCQGMDGREPSTTP